MVKLIMPLILAFLLHGTLLISASSAAVTLDAAYRAALANNENSGIQDEVVLQAEERYQQAKGTLFPTINGVVTYQKQQAPSVPVATSPSSQTIAKITAAQPIFHGMREYSALRQQGDQSEAAKLSREQALVSLFVDVATVYYQVLMSDQDLKDLKRESAVNSERLAELNRFRKLGRSRESDVLLLQSNVAILDAAIEAGEAAILNARTSFHLITGLDSNSVLTDQFNFPSHLAPKEEYLAKAEKRSDLLGLQKNLDAADEGVWVAKGQHIPYIDLLADYYFDRPTYLQSIHWDVQLALTIPIFQGGVIHSQTKQAVSVRKQAELGLSLAKRQAQRDVENFYQQAQSDFNQIQKEKTAAALSQKTYEAEVRDFRYGLVTNLDVLQSLTTAQETMRAYDRVQYQFKTDYIKLLGATGVRP